jgi:hypothetical protein
MVGAASTLTWASRAEALSLNIALEAPEDTKVRQTGDVFEKVAPLLTARGHSVTVVSGADLDTESKIGAYDVVVLTGTGYPAETDWHLFEGQVESYVNGGEGLVTTGWALWQMVQSANSPFPGVEAVVPFGKGTNYVVGGTITVLPGHPITQGLSDFLNPHYDNLGGGPKVGATVLTRNGVYDDGAAWKYGSGRVVYLGPIYLADYVQYNNEPLLDGSRPDAHSYLSMLSSGRERGRLQRRYQVCQPSACWLRRGSSSVSSLYADEGTWSNEY